MKNAKSSAIAPHLALLAVQIFFGTWSFVGKFALLTFSSTQLVVMRITGAAVCFYLLATFTRQRQPITDRRDFARLTLYSLLGIVFNQFLFVNGLSRSTVINATLLSTLIPVGTLVVSVSLGFDFLSWRKVLGLLVAGLGALALINPFHGDWSGNAMLGNVLLLLNTLSYGAYLAVSGDIMKRYGVLTVITWVFVIGAVVALPVGAYNLTSAAWHEVSWPTWAAIAYIILVPTVGAYYLNAWALARVPPSTVATYIYLQPIIALTFAPLVRGEEITLLTLVASALILLGVTIVTWRPPASLR